jgi:hypothetical protein
MDLIPFFPLQEAEAAAPAGLHSHVPRQLPENIIYIINTLNFLSYPNPFEVS